MAREKEGYRENLEAINAVFPGKVSLNYSELCKLFGYSMSSAKRKWSRFYNKMCGGVPVTTVARMMCAV